MPGTRIPCAAGLALAVLLAACGAAPRTLSATIDARLEAGEALVTCRQSSSGTCHALFITQTALVRVEAKQGETGSAEGLTPATRYCVDVRAPEPGKCRRRMLEEGAQIVRVSAVAQ